MLTGCAVECTPLKRALEATFAAVLPKAAKPFIFLVRWASRVQCVRDSFTELFPHALPGCCWL